MHLYIEKGVLKDGARAVYLRGINLDGRSKMPAQPPLTTFSTGPEFWDGDNVSFVGRPFPLEDADHHFSLLRNWGFNTIRYIFTWEAIEHKGPGIYDDEFVDYTIEVLKLAAKHDMRVFLDPHQDVWGRFSGGSGAPMWTYYAAGLEPKNFWSSKAALVQNTMENPKEMPKMLWPTNYYRLACQVMFTLFFAGKYYAPRCVIDGVNIQDYLQNHMLDACMYLYKRIQAAGLFDDNVFGVESMNEPNPGLVGNQDITILPHEQNLRLASTPTAFQSMLLGSGRKVKVAFYDFGSLGPRYRHKHIIDPKNVSAWCSNDSMDKHYGFHRSPDWPLGHCIWALHGVWDEKTGNVLKKNYFGEHNGVKVDEDYFVNTFFIEYWRSLLTRVRSDLGAKVFVLCQPPTLAKPPRLKGTDLVDDAIMYSPHFYDGLTLMLKRWSSVWNVDALGYLRGHYKFPIMAIKFGEQSIRQSLCRQLDIIVKEGCERIGKDVPILMSETGVPMDMNDKEPFLNNNYTPQIKALDATSAAMEHHCMHFTYWCYQGANTNEHGDQWNHEDFSFMSTHGPRAMEAFVRPGPESIVGKLIRTTFRLARLSYHLTIDAEDCLDERKECTEIFVPSLHFPNRKRVHIKVSGGTTEWVDDNHIHWHHPVGRQTLKITTPDSCIIS